MQCVLFDGFDLLDAVAPFEALSAGAMLAGVDMQLEFAALGGARSVSSGISGILFPATAEIDPTRADVILVPGAAGELGDEGPQTVPAILGRSIETGLPQVVATVLARTDAIVATVCGGSLLLALAGVIDDRRVTTHHLGMEILRATGAIAIDARVVDDGNLVSGGGVTSGLDVGIYLVERLLGPKVANAVERLFEFERRGTVWSERGLSPVPG